MNRVSTLRALALGVALGLSANVARAEPRVNVESDVLITFGTGSADRWLIGGQGSLRLGVDWFGFGLDNNQPRRRSWWSSALLGNGFGGQGSLRILPGANKESQLSTSLLVGLSPYGRFRWQHGLYHTQIPSFLDVIAPEVGLWVRPEGTRPFLAWDLPFASIYGRSGYMVVPAGVVARSGGRWLYLLTLSFGAQICTAC